METKSSQNHRHWIQKRSLGLLSLTAALIVACLLLALKDSRELEAALNRSHEVDLWVGRSEYAQGQVYKTELYSSRYWDTGRPGDAKEARDADQKVREKITQIGKSHLSNSLQNQRIQSLDRMWLRRSLHLEATSLLRKERRLSEGEREEMRADQREFQRRFMAIRALIESEEIDGLKAVVEEAKRFNQTTRLLIKIGSLLALLFLGIAFFCGRTE